MIHLSTQHLGTVILVLLLVAVQAAQDRPRPEDVFREAVAAWQGSDWKVWGRFSERLWNLLASSTSNDDASYRLEIVGALEEGILVIEKAVFQQGQGHNPPRDAALSLLYTTYAQALMALTPSECLSLALDPHTLLMGAETVDKAQPPSQKLCLENAENSLRNAISLDATNHQATFLVQELTGQQDVHQRKPLEFVAQLFDQFAETFDDKLLHNLEYKVPALVGELAKTVLAQGSKLHYSAVLDAGCGTGLAGRHLRPSVVPSTSALLLGVDASQNMLDKAALCTLDSGCGLPILEPKDSSPLLYDGLVRMDLESMTTESILDQAGIRDQQIPKDGRFFDLIVAADVLVYFGRLDDLLGTFARISIPGSTLLFSCELTTKEEAPQGWRLLPSGRFAHTKEHAVDAAASHGYQLVHYQEIVPRMEKGEPVRGHLFAFRLEPNNEKESKTEL